MKNKTIVITEDDKLTLIVTGDKGMSKMEFTKSEIKVSFK